MADAILRDAAAEAAKLALKMGSATVDVVSLIADLGEELPLLKPALGTLAIICQKVETVRNLPEESTALCKRCTYLTACVVTKCRRISSGTNVARLDACLQEAAKCIEDCGKRGMISRTLKASHDKAEFARLNASLDCLSGDLGLAGIVTVEQKVLSVEQKVNTIMARLRPRPKLAEVPREVPMGQSWHTTREGAMDQVCEILSDKRGPRLAALAGRSGSGKTTAAAAMVGERGIIRPREGETEDQSRARMDRVRALFPDGVVWLQVGKGEGAEDRLLKLMQKLAQMFCRYVKKGFVQNVEDKDDVCFIKRVVSQHGLRSLVVADDVWEASVVEKLRETGMWLLLTTRDVSIVEPHETVMMDELTEAEAEGVLRGAARLPAHERLNDDAVEILKICGNVAMDVAFVGSWSSVRTGNDGVPKSREAWSDVKRNIEKIIRGEAGRAAEAGDLEVNRLAILRAGFKYLGLEHPLAPELYLALAVFPDGHGFEGSHAAALMKEDESCCDQTQVTMDIMAILERWGVVRASSSSPLLNRLQYRMNAALEYRMHDAHVEFAREKLMDRGDIRKQAVRRWTAHISLLKNIRHVDLYSLLRFWNALERVGGNGWWSSRPYDAQLTDMATESFYSVFFATVLVAQLYEHSNKQAELVPLMRKVIKSCDDSWGGTRVAMAALWYVGRSLLGEDRVREHTEATRRLAELTDRNLGRMSESEEGDCQAQSMTLLNTYGNCAWAAGRPEDAERFFRRARSLHDAQMPGHGHDDYSQIVFARYGLALCLMDKGKWEEAGRVLRQVLNVKQAVRESSFGNMCATWHIGEEQVAVTQVQLGGCLRMAGRLQEAEELLMQALKTYQTKKVWNIRAATTLKELGRCARDGGRLSEAEEFFSRAQINESEPDAVERERCEMISDWWD